MRVLQLIDSLEVGGAERVAVNIANALSTQIDQSFLCATRKEGLLKEKALPSVNYLFLNKKRTLDYKATTTLLKYIKTNSIDLIHAHSSSFFLAVLIKLCRPNTKIIWHDHYGNSAFLEQRSSALLRLSAKCFSHIFCVNKVLVAWAQQSLKAKRVSFLPNFAVKKSVQGTTVLAGVNGKRILCLANLRHQKDHENLLKAFKIVSIADSEWTLHCVGKDFKDSYSKHILNLIDTLALNNRVFFYGSQPDNDYIIGQAAIGVLASASEGLPLALLEYGLGKLPVVATDVGDCAAVIQDEGLGQLVPKDNPKALAQALLLYLQNDTLRDRVSHNLYTQVTTKFSEQSTIKTIMTYYQNIVTN